MATLAPLAEVLDLSDWLGEPITEAADVTRAESVLAAASVLVRNFTGKTWLVDELIDPALPDDVLMVAVQVAARGYINPEGWRDEQVDDWSGRGRVVPEAGLFLTASEKTILGTYRAVTPRGIGVMGTTRWPAATADAGYVPTDGGTWFPWY
jgi:hypothetical protein